MANRIKLAGTTNNDFQVGLTGTGNTTTGNITVATSTQSGNVDIIQNSNTTGNSGLRITGNFVSGGSAGQIQTLSYRGTPSSPTTLNDNDYVFQIQNLGYTGHSMPYQPLPNYGFAGDFAFHKNDEIPSPTFLDYVGSFFQITQFGNDGTNDNLYDYNIRNGELKIGGFSPTDSFGPANTSFTVTVQDSGGATNSFSFLNNGNFSGSNNVTANFFYGDGGHLSNLPVANVTGLGNIATINLDGNSSNLLYGNGTFAPISITSVANANYANFANLSSFVSIVNDAANATNQQVLYCNSGGGNSQLKYDTSFTYNPNSNSLSVANTITSQRYVSTISAGTAPFTVTSTTLVANLHVERANIADTSNSVTVANVVGIGNIATVNLDGNSSNVLFGNGVFAGVIASNANYANFAGQVVDATQSNITSLGTLTSLTVSGNGNIANLKLNQFQETVYSIGTTSGTITPDFNNGSIQSMTLNGNVTINSLGNAIAGRSMTLIINQDATGNRTLTSSMLFAGNSKTLSTAASSKDLISVFYDGSSYWATLSKGYA